MRCCMWGVIWLTLLCGCVRDEYELELVPEGAKLERTLTVKRHQSRTAQEIEPEAQRLAKLYGAKPIVPSSKLVVSGRFSDRMPADLGGFGEFSRWESPLGNVTRYSERFRGNDDLQALLKDREAASLRMAELIADWLKQELQEEACWPTLQKFLQQEFPRDLVNFSLHAWMMGAEDSLERYSPPIAELFHHLSEHGYCTPKDGPAFRRAWEDANRDDYRRLLDWVKRAIAVRAELPTDPLPAWKFLSSWEDLQASQRRLLETTDEYATLQRDWKARVAAGETDAATPPDALEIWSPLLMRIFAGAVQLGGDQLRMTLLLDHAPFATNGSWDDSDGTVVWEKQWLPNEYARSIFAYALWDEPHDAAQRKLFGSTALQGVALLNYCLWYQGLTAEEQLAWNRFLEGISLHQGDLDRVKAFRFPGEPPNVDDARRLAAPAAELFAKALAEKPPR